MPPVLAIAGPTASGKSALALRLAKAIGAEIVNADALQVYSGLQTLTARPTPAEMEGVPHHLYGHIDPSVRHSVGAWASEAEALIRSATKPLILVGGTGLYFKALFEGLADIPDPSEKGRAEAQALLDTSIDSLRMEAQRLDPLATARVLGDDPQRLFRIVSVALGTAKPLSQWQADTRPSVTDWAGVVVDLPRKTLYSRIEARYTTMIEHGGLTEAKTLADRNLGPSLPAIKAIGVAELIAHLNGDLTLAEAITLAKRNSRRLAKRQSTWFRNQTPAKGGSWPRIAPTASAQDILNELAQKSV